MKSKFKVGLGGLLMITAGSYLSDANPQFGGALVVVGLVALVAACYTPSKRKRANRRPSAGASFGGAATPAANQYYSAITGKYYSSQEAKRRDEDLRSANYNASPHCW